METRNKHAKRIEELTEKMLHESGPLEVVDPFKKDPPKFNLGNPEESLMAIQTVTGALLFPFLAIAGIFGFSMGSTNRKTD